MKSARQKPKSSGQSNTPRQIQNNNKYSLRLPWEAGTLFHLLIHGIRCKRPDLSIWSLKISLVQIITPKQVRQFTDHLVATFSQDRIYIKPQKYSQKTTHLGEILQC